MPAISIVEYIHELKEAGFTDQQSEVQARKLEQVIVEVKFGLKQDIQQEFHLDELIRNKDLELAIEIVKKEIVIVKKDLELSIEGVRKEIVTVKKDLELSIEGVRKDLELSIEGVRKEIVTVKKDLELSIEGVRKDLELSIEKSRYDALKFTVWTGVAVVMATAGMLAKGFHWF